MANSSAFAVACIVAGLLLMIVRRLMLRERPSPWWWPQAVVTVLVTCVLAALLYSFIVAATFDGTVVSLECASTASGATSRAPLGLPASEQEKRAAYSLPTIAVDGKSPVRIQAVFSLEFSDFPSPVKSRTGWRVFSLHKDGLWRAVSDTRCRDAFEGWLQAPGRYLVAVALPPTTLCDLGNQTTAQVGTFLSKNERKCRAIQVVCSDADKVAIRKLECKNVDNAKLSQAPIDASVSGEASSGRSSVPTLKVAEKGAIQLRAELTEDSWYAGKLHLTWRVFRLGQDNKWAAMQHSQPGGDSSEFALALQEPGRYLVVTALPPISLSALDSMTTEQMGNLLAPKNSAKCRALQIAFSPPPPPLPPETPPPPVTGGETKPSTRDLSSTQEGVKNGGGIAQPIPPSAGERAERRKEARKLLMEGKLPPIGFRYTKAQLAQLTPNEWNSICEHYHIPFIVVPEDIHAGQFPSWPMLVREETAWRKLDMGPEDIRQRFGTKMIDLGAYSSEVQSTMQDQIGDAAVWLKCRKYRGFLISDFLAEAALQVAEQLNVPVDMLSTQIEQISFSLVIERSPGGQAVMRISNLDLTKKGQ